jgi:hypothetical protein
MADDDSIDIDAEFLGVVDAEPIIPSYGNLSFVESEELPVDPIPEPPPSFDDVSIGDGTCIVCGAPTFRPPGLTKTGRRKRVPRHCDLHSANAKISSDGPSAARLESQLQRVQEELADDLRLLGTLAGPLLPTTGYYLIEEADPFTIALLKLCKNNTRMLRVLHRVASVAPVYEVAKTCAGIGYAIQVDTQGADPHNTVGKRLGVARAYDAVYPNPNGNDTNSSSNNGSYSGPPRYATLQ